jgi:myo-inositol-1(or 4)-monophosphatase
MAPTTPAVAAPELLTLAIDIAREAAVLILERRALGFDFATKTSATDLVTEVDHAAEALIVERLAAARPDDGVNGEEGASHPGTSGIVWHIDPIDGTTNFVYGLPGFAVSLAAELRGQVIAGAVVDAVRDEAFGATLGGGATCNGVPIACSEADDLSRALVATGFSYLAERRARQAAVLTQVLPQVRDIRRLGAAATDLCAVACGRVDAFYEKGLHPWDFAAGALIASEAGASVGNLDGGPASTGFTLAAAPSLFGSLRSLLRDAGADVA